MLRWNRAADWKLTLTKTIWSPLDLAKVNQQEYVNEAELSFSYGNAFRISTLQERESYGEHFNGVWQLSRFWYFYTVNFCQCLMTVKYAFLEKRSTRVQC